MYGNLQQTIESIMFRYISVILYLFLIGCEDNLLGTFVEKNNTDAEEIHQVFYFDLDGRLPMDENGFSMRQ